jgi:glycosyltransferase involved in cell wall biosynthesis
MSDSLTVVLPVYNEAQHLPSTIEALVGAVEGSGFDADLVLVDDGSTDGSSAAVIQALRERLPLTIVSQMNGGRFQARRAGLEAAKGEWALLLDSRVRLATGTLAFVHDRIGGGARVWTGHVDVDAEGNPYGTFWALIAELGWHAYFVDPRETSFGSGDFDRYPKGTGCFLAPRRLLLDAIDVFRSRYADLRHGNDDAPLLRWVAERERIHLSPRFRCSYRPRLTARAFLRHSYHRGLVFLDGHGRRESRFFPVVVAFFPMSAALALLAPRKPSVIPLAGLSVSLVAATLGVARRRSPFEVASLALLAPVYALAHGLGMWRGLLMILELRRLRGGARR